MTFYIISILSIFLLIVLSAFFSSSETALTASNKIRIKNAAENGNKRAAAVKKLTDNFTETLSTILLSNNLVNITASTIMTMMFVRFMGETAAAQTLATITITLLLLILGEIYPKLIGAEYCDSYVYFCALPINALSIIFRPLTVSVDLLIKKASVIWTPKEAAPTATTDELVSIVDEMEDDGGFTETEGEIIRGAINFTEKTAKDILTPRVDVLAFDIEDGAEALAKDRELLEYARFPVYRESLDHVIGIITTRSFACEYLRYGKKTDIESLLTPPLYVHMTREISSILHEMREKKCEMAIVLDEFGGTLGVITVEDIVEEIVGDIFDESDDLEPEFVKEGDTYYIDGGMNIYDLFDIVDYNDHDFESEYTTVGGWAAEMLNKIPEDGDSFEFDNLFVTVLRVNNMRVEELSVKVSEKEEDGEED